MFMFKNCMCKCPEKNGCRVRKFLKGQQVSSGIKQGEWKPRVEHLPGTHKALGSMPSREKRTFTFPFYLLLVCQEQPALATCSHHWAHGAKQPRTEPSKTMSQNKPFLRKWSLIGGQEQAKTKEFPYTRGEGFKRIWASELHTRLPH